MGRNRPSMLRKISIIRMRNGRLLTDPISSVINSLSMLSPSSYQGKGGGKVNNLLVMTHHIYRQLIEGDNADIAIQNAMIDQF